jgi:hypothetical protein
MPIIELKAEFGVRFEDFLVKIVYRSLPFGQLLKPSAENRDISLNSCLLRQTNFVLISLVQKNRSVKLGSHICVYGIDEIDRSTDHGIRGERGPLNQVGGTLKNQFLPGCASQRKFQIPTSVHGRRT